MNGSNDEKEEEMDEGPKMEELDDYGKLVKAIEGTSRMYGIMVLLVVRSLHVVCFVCL